MSMFKPKPVTSDEFNHYKAIHGHRWKFLGKEFRCAKNREKKILCKCELCGKDSYVFWKWIRQGRSKTCKSCFRIPNLEEINSKLQAQGKYVRINKLFRIRKKKDGSPTRIREYWVTCTSCGESRWLLWSHVSIRAGLGCRSCAMRAKVSGSPAKKNAFEIDLRKRWLRMSYLKESHGVEWQSYEEFKKWCLENGYALGRKLGRKKRSAPYGPSNCKFIDTVNMQKYKINRDRNTISTVGRAVSSGF